jgi:hypothetical protein
LVVARDLEARDRVKARLESLLAPDDLDLLLAQLDAAGHHSWNPVQVTSAPVETVFCAPVLLTSTCGTTNASGRTQQYDITVAALDTTGDHRRNYDTLVFFDGKTGIQPGPFGLPSTGPAYVRANGQSGRFFFLPN